MTTSIKLHFCFLKFEVVLILVSSGRKFSFWFTKFDTVFKIVILYISIVDLTDKCEQKDVVSSLLPSPQIARSVLEINERSILKMQSKLLDQNEKSQT